MSKVNFFKKEYITESPRIDSLCGIIDGVNENPAYTITTNPENWNATIVNPNGQEFLFIPIDHNIKVYKADGKSLDGTCDGMILVDVRRLLAFVELKDIRSGGFADALGQLWHTIEIFLQNHQYTDFRLRRAYAANIAHPHFHYNMKDEMEDFKNKLHFTLFPEATITIK